MKTLGLYGGKEEIRKRITAAVQYKLKGIVKLPGNTGSHLQSLEKIRQNAGIPKADFWDLLSTKESTVVITYCTFEKLSPILSIPVKTVLGEPVYQTGQEAALKEEHAKEGSLLSFEAFLLLNAVEELAEDDEGQTA